MERSEVEKVKLEIAEVKAELAEAKKAGLPIDNPGVLSLRNNLTELQKKENLLLERTLAGESLIDSYFAPILFLILNFFILIIYY